MPSRRTIKGALHNFLGTYTSRYSELDGYWLFGLLLDDIERLKIDLLHISAEGGEGTPQAAARQLAATKFAEQMTKAGLAMSRCREAHLDIIKSADSRQGVVNGHMCSGYDLRFVARAVTDLGKTYERQISMFVAPHNPKREWRSARAD